MSCLLNFRLIFAVIGWNIGGGRGLILGFLLGWLFDSMYRRPRVHFTFKHGTADDFTGYRGQEQTWQPYVDVTLQEAYRTLGLRETASDEEVRKVYRQMALRYHPDRVQSKSEAERKVAEEKFRQITEARDVIFRARGI